MELRQWMSRRRDPWRRSPFERFVFLWLVPILVILMLSFFAAAHP